MEMRILTNGIVYVIVTAFFSYIWWRQRLLAEKIQGYRLRFGKWLMGACNIQKESVKRKIQKTIDLVESLFTALVLVLLLQHFYIGNFKIPTPSMVHTIEIGDRVLANMVLYKFSTPKREDVVVFKEPMEGTKNYTKRIMGLPGETIKIQDNALYVDGVKIESRAYSNLQRTTEIPRSLSSGEEWRVPKKGDHLVILPSTNYKQLFVSNGLNPNEIQQEILKNAVLSFIFMPNLKFYVNGKETGPIMDFLHDNRMLNRLMAGESVELTLEDNYYFALGDNTENSADSRIWGFVKQNRITGEVLFRFWPLNRIGLVK